MNAIAPISATDHVPLVECFRLQAWARAYLAHAGELDLHEAVDVLQADAEAQGLVDVLGQDAVQEILAECFREVFHD